MRYLAPMIGRTVSHYKITAKLGAGGMGEVYLAEDTRLDREVALKFLPTALWNETESQQRLIREAKAASKLDHPNIVTIYGIEELDGRPFIIMAHVHGTTLSEYCTAKRRSIDALIDLAIQMAGGLHHAHSAGVVHRDLKPSNILVDEQDRVRVLDFGIASLRGATRLTRAGTTMGTLAYAPPELAMGEEATASSDVYSLGVVMYQMLSGELPFEADHEAALLYSILNETPRSLSDFDAGIPSDLQAVVMRCLEKAPENRYATCADLAAELKRCQADGVSPSLAAAEQPSVAVLPFTNMSADPENEYFSDGLTEELINVLAKNPGLRVTGRTSSFAFKGKHEDLREIGQKLGVETLLEGSVRKAANRVRITAQLVKTVDGFHLWSETYDRVIEDIFAVQDEIAEAVATALHVTLLGKPTTKRINDSESYTLALRASHLERPHTKTTTDLAADLYQKALDLDSDNAQAWAGLARVFTAKASCGYDDVQKSYRRAKEAAMRALEIDDTLADAHQAMGWIRALFEYHFDEAGVAFRKALSLAPNNSKIVSSLASYESSLGHFEESLRLLKQALELDPLNPGAHMNHGWVLLWTGRLTEARDAFHRVQELSPSMTAVNLALSWTYLFQGRLEEALSAVENEEAGALRNCGLAIVYHAMGKTQESDRALVDLVSNGEDFGFQLAITHAYRDERDKAFEWLERSAALRDAGVTGTKVHPLLQNLHSDPRWPKFLEKIGLAD